ncbi:MAG: helix-turn-helix domain-containing protein [bacterium]|nr:helix-turn-helix domain-containing protein [bacterium]MCP4133023.1 helix-turn-helix domain-containing protein [bacterium]
MSFGEKIKALRKEKGWSQDELGNMISVDGRQISRYENDRMLPSADVIIKLATTLNASIDYLLLEDVDKKPIYLYHKTIINKLQEVGKMDVDDTNSVLHFLDTIAAKNRLLSLANNVKEGRSKVKWKNKQPALKLTT